MSLGLPIPFYQCYYPNIRKETFKMIMQTALLFVVQRYVVLTLPLCIAVVYIVQRIYLRTSRQLRLLELESRSAVYSSFLETVRLCPDPNCRC